MNNDLLNKMISESVQRTFLMSSKQLAKFGEQEVIPALDGELTIRAIDIGYGFTKYTKGIDKNGDIVCDLFPSIAALSPPTDNLGGDFFVVRDTKQVDLQGVTYEVGPDVSDIKSDNDVRALHDNYIKTEQWKALFLGALAYMGESEIDFLVLGLPVSNMKQKDDVIALATGKHVVDGQEFNIKNVLVIPQPLGALYNYAIKSDNFEKFLNTSTLTMDVGYLTFDFLVTKGMSVASHRSGARPGGMNSILNAISNSLSKDNDIEFEDLEQIDAALGLMNKTENNGDRLVRVYGREIDLKPHIKNTVPVIEASMNYMLTRIGNSKDISQLILAGGPNKIFEKAIKKQFPHNELHIMEDGIFANVKGFLLWAILNVKGRKLLEKSKP